MLTVAHLTKTIFGLVWFGLVSWGGVRLCPLDTSAALWPIVPALDDG
jgi:hypothetical protein